VQRLFRSAGIDLAPGITDKNTTPEDISRTPVPHITYLLQRGPAKVGGFRTQLQHQVKSHLQKIRRRAGKPAKSETGRPLGAS
jgi:hypothetical protein